jgi:transcriptional regulator with XRE-family HTH domain
MVNTLDAPMSSIPSDFARKLAYVSSLGERIKSRREYLEKKRGFDFPQAELARKVGVERSSVSQWENGSTHGLKPENLLNTRDVLETTVDWLVWGRDPRCDADGNIVNDDRASRLDANSITVGEAFQVLPEELKPSFQTAIGAVAKSTAKWVEGVTPDRRRRGKEVS